ncbi:MAG: hypothetical protein ACKO3S_12770 [bacterium]
MTPQDRARGLYIIGHPGQGKTTLVQNMIIQDMNEGNGLIFLTSEEETFTERILPFVPDHRIADVVYINPRDTQRPVVFNPLHVNSDESFEQKRSQTITILRRLFAEASATPAPRTEMILSHAVSTLMQIPGSTLEDIPKLVNPYDATFRKWAVERIRDERDRAFWTEPSMYARFPKDSHLPLFVRLNPLLRTSSVRAILNTPGHSFNLRTAMDSGKIVLVNLADGILGAQEATVIGQLIVSQLQLATMSRAEIPEHDRRPFYAYLDEFQKFCNTDSVSYLEMLARGRRYRVPLILAHQETGQIPDAIMRGIFGTVSTMAAFTISYADAMRLGREMRVGEPAWLQDQPVGQCHCRLARRTFALRTDPPPTDGSEEVVEEIIRRSRETYGVAWSARPEAPSIEVPSPVIQVPPTQTHVESAPRQVSPPAPAPPSSAVVSEVPRPGRGGTQHKYLQELISRWATANDWRATIEERILDGLGSVDVALRKGELSVACEIGVTTEPEHEVQNVQKCLASGFTRVVFVSPEKKTRNQIKARLASVLEGSQVERVTICDPEELFEHLTTVEESLQTTEQTVRGYKVKVRMKPAKTEEKARKQNAVSAIIAKAMKRLKKDKE